MSFEKIGLSADILRALAEQGYTSPTPVQSQAIPVILEGKDVLAGAQTGTGKTAGFTLPLIQKLSEDKAATKKHKLRALILTPTRELAAQVAESVQTYGQYLDLRSAVIFGGVKINPQIAALKKGLDVLVATPGRLLDHVGQGTIDLSTIEVFVLDEADRMLDMGFINDIKKVLALLPKKRQNLLFSATFSNEIKTLADRLLDHPVPIEVARRNTAAETVEQAVYRVDRKRKSELLSFLIGSNNWKQVLVFTRTKHGANRLAQHLEKDGLTAAAIHGNKSQGARTRALASFKSGDVRVLVATDIAARGLDIDQLPHVVNFELPNVAEDYVHRIGRTGRAGNEGEAVSLVCVDEDRLMKDIEKLLGRKIRSEVVEGFEVDPSIKAEPIQNGRGQKQGQRRPQGQGQQRRQQGAQGAGQKQQNRSRRADAQQGDEQRPARARAAADGQQQNERGAQRRRPQNTQGQQRPQSRGNANARPQKRVQRDENGDPNGNTVNADNSNRSATVLADGNHSTRGKYNGGNANRPKKGQNAKRQGQGANSNKKRRSGNANGNGGGNRRSSPSLLGG